MSRRPPICRSARADQCAARAAAEYEQRRRDEQLHRGWYKLALWLKRLRPQQLARQALCETCLAASPPRITEATVVHHRIPHKGDWSRFVDPGNHASACKLCHDTILQREERRASAREGAGGQNSGRPSPGPAT